MSDQPRKPYVPITSTPYGEPDPARVGVTRMEPCFEHFCSVCGAGAGFGFGGDFAAGQPGIWACSAHRSAVERKWKGR